MQELGDRKRLGTAKGIKSSEEAFLQERDLQGLHSRRYGPRRNEGGRKKVGRAGSYEINNVPEIWGGGRPDRKKNNPGERGVFSNTKREDA